MYAEFLAQPTIDRPMKIEKVLPERLNQIKAHVYNKI